MKNVTLIGMPGAGKSTVGVLLAKALGFAFIDTDLVLQRQQGALLQDILNARGQAAFLDAEADAICTLRCQRTVIAPGGSAVCRPAAMEHLRALGAVVYLRLPYEVVEARIRNIKTRGIAMAPGQTLRDIYALRAPLYEAYAHSVVDGQETLEDTIAAVLQALAALDAAFSL